jgi:predicted short-subunit dehydrogenase-like oxidoreductase (DUF2520 family)
MIADASFHARVAVVGSGRLGRALARALEARDVLVSLHRGRAEEAGDGEPARVSEGLVLLAVPDGAIAEVAARLAAALGDARPVVLHLSGALASGILAPLRDLGCAVGSCHPLQTFPDPEVPAGAFEGVAFGIEGDEEARRTSEALARMLGGVPVALEADRKVLWHLAAVLAGNGAVALVGAAVDAMRAAGLDEVTARAALAPLARRSLEGALAKGPVAALSGPVARGDTQTLASHRAALAAWDPARRPLYDALVLEQERLVARRDP